MRTWLGLLVNPCSVCILATRTTAVATPRSPARLGSYDDARSNARLHADKVSTRRRPRYHSIAYWRGLVPLPRSVAENRILTIRLALWLGSSKAFPQSPPELRATYTIAMNASGRCCGTRPTSFANADSSSFALRLPRRAQLMALPLRRPFYCAPVQPSYQARFPAAQEGGMRGRAPRTQL